MTATALTPPENGIVKGFRRISPFVMFLDIAAVAIIAIKFFMVLFVPETSSVIEGSGIVFFEVAPAVAVVMTAMLALNLITSRLSSLEVDKAQVNSMGDAKAKTERTAYLAENISVCKQQRGLSWALMVGYVVVAGIPRILHVNTSSLLGEVVFLAITAGEMSIPALNIRTFAIVEATMGVVDSVGNAIHASNGIVMQALQGIASRAQGGTLDRSDRRALKAARRGDIDGALSSRDVKLPEPIQGAMYLSLRQRVTGVPDGKPLDVDQERRYARAQTIARRYRTENSPWLAHFKHGQHRTLLVDSEVGDMIIRDLGQVRIRPSRYKQPVTSE